MRKRGYWGGYLAHRYRDRKAPIMDPQPILKDVERKRAVSFLMDSLGDWRTCRFEREAATVAGLRSAFCLAGFGWDRANKEAATLVSTAYTNLGYARPTWEEGQPGYTIPVENCLWCGGLVPDDLNSRSHTGRYCTASCAQKALHYREIRSVGDSRDAYCAAQSIICRMKHEPRPCAQCGKLFRPLMERATKRYCSLECSSLSQITVPQRECLCCGKSFRPSNNLQPGKYCSVECTNQSFKNQSVAMTCACCGISFIAKNKISRYCSPRCKKIALRFKSGNLPKHLTPKVFDYVFKQAA